jgi:hypothetical protein
MSRPKSNILYLVFLPIALSSSAIALQYGYSQTTTTTTTTAYASANPTSILSSPSFRDDTGVYHIVDEVKNNSPADSMNT